MKVSNKCYGEQLYKLKLKFKLNLFSQIGKSLQLASVKNVTSLWHYVF